MKLSQSLYTTSGPELSVGPFLATRPNPTHPINWVTQSNPTRRKSTNMDPSQLNPIQQQNCPQLMIFHYNYGRILYRFPNKAIYWLKMPIFHTHVYLSCTVPCNCMLCNHKNMVLLSYTTQPIKNYRISTQPNPRVDPTREQLWSGLTVLINPHITGLGQKWAHNCTCKKCLTGIGIVHRISECWTETTVQRRIC